MKSKKEWKIKYKTIIPSNSGIGSMKKDWLKPMIIDPNTCCTETYLVIGPFSDKKTAENAFTFIQTKFFHLLMSLKKVSQGLSNKVFSFVPLLDFSEPWSDIKLYQKYQLSVDEINYIEQMIGSAELSHRIEINE